MIQLHPSHGSAIIVGLCMFLKMQFMKNHFEVNFQIGFAHVQYVDVWDRIPAMATEKG